ncbi:SRPBCC family protein [Novipirellula rosea]|uniref:Polyketide cyclase / dehydrase and lipid transport n=1 Tax=Novipirellula rosea TaxID=1031540 RepID=A0ABP8MXF6_9BACT
MQSTISIQIDRNIDDVFRLTHQHVAQWSIIVIEDEVIEEKPGGVGTTFRTVTEDHGKRMEFAGVVTRHEPPYVHAVHMTGDMFDIDAEYVFNESKGRTRVTQRANVTGKGIFRWFMLLFGWMMKRSHSKASELEMQSLKKFCETAA